MAKRNLIMEQAGHKPNIILWDTEVSTEIAKGYGPKWDFKATEILRQQELMCYAYKRLGERAVHFVHMHEFNSTQEFVQSLADVLDSADVTIAHNGLKFDDRMANTFFITNGVDRPSPGKSVDTLQVSQRKFKFPSNKLGDLAEYLGIEEKKLEVGYSQLEDAFLDGDPKAIRTMKKYNIQDVKVLEQVYLKLRPYIDNHPNLGTIMQQEGVCPKCGKTDTLQKRGFAYNVTTYAQRYQCMKPRGGCGGWSKSRAAQRSAEKPSIANA